MSRVTQAATVVSLLCTAVLAGCGSSSQVADNAAAAGTSAAESSPTTTDEPSRLERAYERCTYDRKAARTLDLGDEGNTIVIDTHSEYGTIDGVACVLTELNTPKSVIAAVDSTTAMMGVQDADVDGLTYSWSYHPDNGLNMIITGP